MEQALIPKSWTVIHFKPFVAAVLDVKILNNCLLSLFLLKVMYVIFTGGSGNRKAEREIWSQVLCVTAGFFSAGSWEKHQF